MDKDIFVGGVNIPEFANFPSSKSFSEAKNAILEDPSRILRKALHLCLHLNRD